MKQLRRRLGLTLLAGSSALFFACDANPATVGFSTTNSGQLILIPVDCDFVERVVGVRVTNRDDGSVVWEVTQDVAGDRVREFVVGEVPPGWVVTRQQTPLELAPDAYLRVELQERWSGDRLVTITQDVQVDRLQPGLIRAESQLLSRDEFAQYQKDTACP